VIVFILLNIGGRLIFCVVVKQIFKKLLMEFKNIIYITLGVVVLGSAIWGGEYYIAKEIGMAIGTIIIVHGIWRVWHKGNRR